MTEENRPGRVAEARSGFDMTLRTVLAAEDVGKDLSLVAIVGFSQGSIMTLDAVASGRWPVRAVVAMAGRLASPAPLAPAQGTKVLLLHGEADGVLPAQLATEAQSTLVSSGLTAELQTFPGLGHGISPESLEAAGRLSPLMPRPRIDPSATVPTISSSALTRGTRDGSAHAGDMAKDNAMGPEDF